MNAMESRAVDPELLQLEERLRARLSEFPDNALRARVLEAIDIELLAASKAGARSWWDSGHWATAAAAILIALNISMIFASGQEFLPPSGDRTGTSLSTELRLVQQLENQREGSIK
jgi:hypothetical protein